MSEIHPSRKKMEQRYRAVAKSSMVGMRVGDIRFTFEQLRRCNEQVNGKFSLINRQTPGEFALNYLEIHSSEINRRKAAIKIQCFYRVYKSMKIVNILRADPLNLFSSQFSDKRMRMLNIDVSPFKSCDYQTDEEENQLPSELKQRIADMKVYFK